MIQDALLTAIYNPNHLMQSIKETQLQGLQQNKSRQCFTLQFIFISIINFKA